jgi:1-acyl-sn-glycerol-3-phosphate acyltransferase
MTESEFNLRRNDFLASVIRIFAKIVLFSFHQIKMEGLENLPKTGTALLLPKHCTYGRDVTLEGIALHAATGRYASYFMRAIASRFYEWAGGIKIARPKDVRRVSNYKEINDAAFKYVRQLYLHGEIVVSHPEGTRNKHGMGKLKGGVINHLIEVEKEHGLKIPLIPIGIRFQWYWIPFSCIDVRIGKPVYTNQFPDSKQLLEYLENQIAKLSGWIE